MENALRAFASDAVQADEGDDRPVLLGEDLLADRVEGPVEVEVDVEELDVAEALARELPERIARQTIALVRRSRHGNSAPRAPAAAGR
jgi:hypothetical protein